MIKEYAWSDNLADEIWRGGKFSSIEECIRDAVACGKEPGDTIAVGICEDYVPELDAYALLEQVSNDAYEECGEAAEGWPEFECRKGYRDADKLQEALDKVFKEWLKETNQIPRFYHIYPLKDLVVIPEEAGGTE